MKDNNIRKVALIAILLLCLPLAAFAAPNTNADDDSYLAQYMTRYDYVLPQTIIEQIQVNFTPQEADCDVFVNKKVLQKGVKKVSTFNTQ